MELLHTDVTIGVKPGTTRITIMTIPSISLQG